MKPELTILVVDDAVAARTAYCRYLNQDHHYHYSILEADCGSIAMTICQQQMPDVILLNYLLPDMDGLEFLNQLRLQGCAAPVPLIMLAAQGDETLAVQVMKSGAQDYLNLQKLTPETLCRAVHGVNQRMHLLHHLEHQQRQQWLLEQPVASQQEALYQATRQELANRQQIAADLQRERNLVSAILEVAGALIVVLDKRGRIVQFNCMCEQTTGYSFAEVQGRHFWEIFIAPDELEAVMQVFNALRAAEYPNQFENDWTAKNGDRRRISWSNTVLLDLNGAVEYIVATGIDVTEQRQIETALRQSETMNQIIRNALPDLTIRMKQDGTYLDFIPSKYFPIIMPKQDMRGLNIFDLLSREEAEKRLVYVEQALTTGDTQVYDYELEVAGQKTWQEARLVPSGVDEVLVVIRSIDDRKRAEKALAERESRLRAVVQHSLDIIAIVDAQATKQFVSASVVNYLGFTSEELVGTSAFERIHPADVEAVQFAFLNSMQQPEMPIRVDFRFCHRDGHWVDLELVGTNLLHMPELRGIIVNMRDVTDRKQTERLLQESRRHYLTLAEASPVGIARYDANGHCTYVNDRWCEITGLPLQAVIGNGWQECLHPDWRETVAAQWQMALQQSTPCQIEACLQQPDGTLRWVYWQAVPELDDSGNLLGYVGTLTDITSQKQVEEALRESERRVLNMTSNLPGVAYECVAHSDGTFSMPFVSAGIEELAGFTVAQVEATPSCIFGMVHPEDQESFLSQVQHSIVTLEDLQHEHRIVTRSGQVKWISDVARYTRKENGDIVADGIAVDISDRKFAEEALRQSEEKFRQIAKHIREGFFLCTPDYNQYLYFSPAMATICGCSLDYLYQIPRFWDELMHPDDRAKVLAKVPACIQQDFNLEHRIIRPDGAIRWLSMRFSPVRNDAGLVYRVVGVCEDITARKQAKIALAESEGILRAMFERSAVGIITLDQAGRFVRVNPAFQTMIGYSEGELKSMRFVDLTYEADYELNLELFQETLRGDRNLYQLEKRYYRKDGQIIWVRLTASPILDKGNQPQLIVSVIEDVTARKQAEAALQKLNRELEVRVEQRTLELSRIRHFLQNIIDHLPVAVFVKDVSEETFGTFRLWNKTCELIFGLTAEAAIGKTDYDLFPPEEADWFWRKDREVLQRGVVEEILEESVSSQTLGERVLHTVKIPIYDQNHQPEYLLCISEDITDRKQAELALQHNQQLKEAIFNDSADAIFLVDAKTIKTIDCNRRTIELFEATSKDELIGISGHTLQRTPFTPAELATILHSLETKGFWSQELEYVTRRGNQFWGNLAAKRIMVAGQSMHLVRISDISDRKQTEIRLQQTNEQLSLANAELARATRHKDEFLANMSHELRTPLNAILGMTEALSEEICGELTPHQRKAVSTIDRSGKHLLELINDILDLAKIEAGKLEMTLDQVSVPRLCESSLAMVKQLAYQKNIDLTLQLAPDLPDIQADDRRLRQVLVNLLSNAIKFTPKNGQVTLTVTTSGTQSNLPSAAFGAGQVPTDYVFFTVSDTGIGIAAEHIDKIFQPFVQVDSSLNRQYTGTGLGLALVRRIATLHRGAVTVQSTEGKGSQFTLWLPLYTSGAEGREDPTEIADLIATRKTASVTATDLSSASSSLILLVEDNQDNIDTLSDFLNFEQYEFVVATNGRDAIQMAQDHQPGLIIMDIQMSGMDGLEAIRQIRSIARLTTVPIIALTALAMAGDRERCLSAGASVYLTKPVSIKQLMSNMQQLLAH